MARLRGLIAAALLALGAPAPLSAAPVDWLLLLVDASGSIDAAEYALQHEAYVRVLRDPEIVALLAGAQVAIVEFAESPLVVVDWTADPAGRGGGLCRPPPRGRDAGADQHHRDRPGARAGGSRCWSAAAGAR